MTGRIIKGIAGFYYVAYQKYIYECKAKGVFRNKSIKPMVGDLVEFSVIDEEAKEGNIDDILPRKNSIIRPAVSNIDLAIIIAAVKSPDPQLYLIDKYLISMDMQHIPVVMVWNKQDLSDDKAKELKEVYDLAGYKSFITSTYDHAGISELLSFIKGKSTVLAGPSGVGKSSLTNILCPEADMVTNTISRKIERGRHTTRHSEFFVVDADTFICDTPGFTSVMVDTLEADELKAYMPDIYKYEGKCKFTGCNHIKEPGCAVKEALSQQAISQSRYDSYVKIYEELKSKRRY